MNRSSAALHHGHRHHGPKSHRTKTHGTAASPHEVLGEAVGLAVALPLYIAAAFTVVLVLAQGLDEPHAVTTALTAGIAAAIIGLIAAWRLLHLPGEKFAQGHGQGDHGHPHALDQ
jgi:hypothetical protein